MRPPRFRLRTLMVAVAAVAVLLGIMVRWPMMTLSLSLPYAFFSLFTYLNARSPR